MAFATVADGQPRPLRISEEEMTDGGSLLLLSLVAATNAAMVAWVFLMAWRDGDGVAAVVLGVAFVGLAVTAISFVLASLAVISCGQLRRACEARERAPLLGPVLRPFPWSCGQPCVLGSRQQPREPLPVLGWSGDLGRAVLRTSVRCEGEVLVSVSIYPRPHQAGCSCNSSLIRAMGSPFLPGIIGL
jgi:hypothetical protein